MQDVALDLLRARSIEEKPEQPIGARALGARGGGGRMARRPLGKAAWKIARAGVEPRHQRQYLAIFSS